MLYWDLPLCWMRNEVLQTALVRLFKNISYHNYYIIVKKVNSIPVTGLGNL
jgi:hypothetical protein